MRVTLRGREERRNLETLLLEAEDVIETFVKINSTETQKKNQQKHNKGRSTTIDLSMPFHFLAGKTYLDTCTLGSALPYFFCTYGQEFKILYRSPMLGHSQDITIKLLLQTPSIQNSCYNIARISLEPRCLTKINK